jgi:hypothetical protein
MIIKASLGNGFKGALQYVHKSEKELKEKERPEIVLRNNVIGSNPNFIAYQMREQANESGYSKKPVLHLSFAFAPEDNLSSAQEIEAVKASMLHLKISEEKHQYVLVKHNDTNHSHSHYHAIINKVDDENKILDTNWIKNKCVVAADKIEQEHNLHRVQGRNIKFEDTEKGYKYTPKEERIKQIPKLNEYETKVNKGITEVLTDKKTFSFDDFKKELEKKNIKVRLNVDEKTNQIKGTSFRLNEKSAVNVSGSKIGYSANVISQKLEQNKTQTQSKNPIKPIQTEQANRVQPTAEPPKQNPIKPIQTEQANRVQPTAEPPRPKPMEKPMEKNDIQFTQEYNQRIEKVVNAHNSELERGNYKPDTERIFKENGFSKENDKFVFSFDDQRKEVSAATFENNKEKALEIAIKQKITDENYNKLQAQQPEKVPFLFGKEEIIKRNLELKRKQASPKLVMQKPKLESRDFQAFSKTLEANWKAEVQKREAERQAKIQERKSQNKNRGFKR